jgi:AcrR family transcriptional regulator
MAQAKTKPRADAAPKHDPAQTREQIRYAAAHLMRDQGYATTTLRQIADATGIKAGSIYYHFASKDDILLDVLETGMKMVTDSVKGRLDRIGRDASARKLIAAAIEGHLLGLLAHGDFTSANTRVYAQLPEALKKRHRPSRRAYSKYWDRILETALRDGELRADMPVTFLRMLILGTLNWTVEWYEPSQHGTVEEFAVLVTAVIFDGILVARRASIQAAGRR